MAGMTGGRALQKRLRDFAKGVSSSNVVVAGFLENATYPNGMHVATVAALNNFGAPGAGIPPRPFFTDMIAEKSGTWPEKARRLLRSTGYDGDKTLALMGEGISGQIRQAIVAMNEPANSPVTNILKQRFPTGEGYDFSDVQQARADVRAGVSAPAGKPLVWSGVMLGSVDYEVRAA